MPLEKLESLNQRAWGLWHIQEAEAELIDQSKEFETIPANITHEQKRLDIEYGCLGYM